MKKSATPILALAVLFLFLLQAAGTLVESIYILNLLQAAMDEKVLGVLFFFAPVLLLPFYKRYPRPLVWAMFAVLFFARGVLPYADTAGRMLASGFATFAVLSLLFLLPAAMGAEARGKAGLWTSAGLGLAVSLSVLLRAAGRGIEYSLTPAGAWAGWALGLLLGGMLALTDLSAAPPPAKKEKGGVTAGILGLFLVIALVWFSFSAPAVIARWTGAGYTPVAIAVGLLSAGWVLLLLARPEWTGRIGPRFLLLWNALFTLCLTGTILAHRVSFPPAPDSAPVVAASPGGLACIPLILMLLLFPVVFFDAGLLIRRIEGRISSPGDLAPGMLLGGLLLVLLVFIHIFTNVWGYVPPVSTVFRNMFWLPYFLAAGGVTFLMWLALRGGAQFAPTPRPAFHWGWAVLLGGIFLLTAALAFPVRPEKTTETDRSSLTVMTVNAQQFNDMYGEKSFQRQLALIREVSPDILAMQETDSARISLNNNDYVRCIAEQLGYYSYYGPSTVAGTFGTAILSRYPLLNTRTVYTYSDTDEIGIAEAEIEVEGRRIAVFNVHPDGSDAAMRAFAEALLDRAGDREYVIALGDYNLRDYEEAYRLIGGFLVDAWASVYPSKISPEGVDMSGENRIDHIFLSPNLAARNPVYMLPPDSATDHPVLWAEIYFSVA